MPSSGLWEQAQPGWRSAADMQRVEAWRAETNVRREGVGSPERHGEPQSPSLTRLGFLAQRASGDGARAAPRFTIVPYRFRTGEQLAEGTRRSR